MFVKGLDGNFVILGSRLYSPNLKDVAGLKDAQLIFNLSVIFSLQTASFQPNLH